MGSIHEKDAKNSRDTAILNQGCRNRPFVTFPAPTPTPSPTIEQVIFFYLKPTFDNC